MKPKDTVKQRVGKGRIFFTTSKENTGDLSGGSISLDSKNRGIFELRFHAYS